MRAVVLQGVRAAASADDEVRADTDGRHDRDGADHDGGHLATAPAGGRRLGRHAVGRLLALLAVGGLLSVLRLLAVRGAAGRKGLLGRNPGLSRLLRVAVAGLVWRGRLLGVAVAGLRRVCDGWPYGPCWPYGPGCWGCPPYGPGWL